MEVKSGAGQAYKVKRSGYIYPAGSAVLSLSGEKGMGTIQHYGDTFDVIGTGVSRTRADGSVEVFCHLASTTRGWHQRNGFYPCQICDYVEASKLDAAGVTFKK